MKSRKFPQKKITMPNILVRRQIEIVEPKEPPFDLNKPGQYSDYWKEAAKNAREIPPGGRP